MLMRFDPFRETDRWLDEGLAALRGRPSVLPLDAYRREGEYVIHLDVPGVDPSEVSLTVEKNVLTVSVERHSEPREGDETIIHERPEGSFTRQLYLGEGLDLENIQANYDKGVLTIRVPVAEAAKPRKVEVKAAPEAIQAESRAAVGTAA